MNLGNNDEANHYDPGPFENSLQHSGPYLCFRRILIATIGKKEAETMLIPMINSARPVQLRSPLLEGETGATLDPVRPVA